MDYRFYLQALGITGLFIALMVVIWMATGGPANEVAIQNANSTRTAIAMTASYLLQPRTRTAAPLSPTSLPETSVAGATSTSAPVPSPTNTSLLPQPNTNTPLPSLAASSIPFPTETSPAEVPVFTITAPPGQRGTKPPPVVAPSLTPATPATLQDPAGFASWYFTRVWNERDYQNLWDNYLTSGFKTNVGSGLFEDYVVWWNSVRQIDVNSVNVLANDGRNARARVDLTFHMQDGRIVRNQIYDYDFLYDPTRGTWMFDSNS